MRVIMTGGGTGGHIYPAISIAQKIIEKEPDSKILYLGAPDCIEAKIVPEMGIDFAAVPAYGFDRGYGKLQDTITFVKAGMISAAGTMKALGIIRKFKPEAVIATGGFVSLPVVTAANMLKVVVYIHEQNVVPGITNRIASKKAKKILLGFEDAGARFADPGKTVYVGNPVREVFKTKTREEAREQLGIPEDMFVALGFGGSIGSKELNEIFGTYLLRCKEDKGKMIIAAAGKKFFDGFIDTYGPAEQFGKSRVLPYISDMPTYLASADLVICRAGAISLAELAIMGKPSILIPFPLAAENHQFHNAKSLADRGAAYLVEEKDMVPEEVCDLIDRLAADKESLEQMGMAAKNCGIPDATERIYLAIKEDMKA